MWCREHVHIQSHKTTHVSWFEKETFALKAAQTHKHAGRLLLKSHRCCCLTHYTSKLEPRWGQNTQIWVTATDRWWEPHLSSSTEAVRAASFICGKWCGLCRCIFKHMLVFYYFSTPSLSFLPSHPPALCGQESSAPAVCLLFMSNVSVAGIPHKPASID